MTIGITGHQKLPDGSGLEWLRGGLISGIKDFKSIIYAYSSLAVGADQLFAKTVLQMSIDLIAVIPCLHYEKTFKGADQNSYFEMLSKCKTIETLDFSEPSEVAFFSAGKQVVVKSDVLFAIWDGNQAKGLGGTGDVVQYALSLKKTVVHLNPISRMKIIHN
ncbi:hypothetical protein [Mucilaginibacter sp. OK098]|uniref:hypothetical protein n=1 Tax=Mucilaginibacter sp. OK098 TaxID=1855297 RepID=UPI00091D5553|nr:hypothetical protein [Mucilaginibacter sp. OK098]SHM77102.1 hypothetical protein SAMN05216524_103350 [Mucilaginibacter sp. OK098]